MELRLQLETLLPVEAVHRCEGKRFFSQDTFQSFTPAFQHGAAYLRGNVRRSPEDLRSQNLEAAVVQDAILEDTNMVQTLPLSTAHLQLVLLSLPCSSTCSGHSVTFMSPLMPFALNMDS